jgi:hypothetical protein
MVAVEAVDRWKAREGVSEKQAVKIVVLLTMVLAEEPMQVCLAQKASLYLFKFGVSNWGRVDGNRSDRVWLPCGRRVFVIARRPDKLRQTPLPSPLSARTPKMQAGAWTELEPSRNRLDREPAVTPSGDLRLPLGVGGGMC